MKKVGLSLPLAFSLAFAAPLLTAPAAQASVVTFNILGQATYGGDNSTQSFSGILGVDTAAGTVTALDIRIPFFPEYTTKDIPFGPVFLSPQSYFFPDSIVEAGHEAIFPGFPPAYDQIFIQFTTSTAGSLVGFNGGTIDGGELDSSSGFGYTNFTGTISTTPLPATWTMMLVGLLGCGLIVHRRKQFDFPVGPASGAIP